MEHRKPRSSDIFNISELKSSLNALPETPTRRNSNNHNMSLFSIQQSLDNIDMSRPNQIDLQDTEMHDVSFNTPKHFSHLTEPHYIDNDVDMADVSGLSPQRSRSPIKSSAPKSPQRRQSVSTPRKSQPLSLASKILSPTRAGAELALYQYPVPASPLPESIDSPVAGSSSSVKFGTTEPSKQKSPRKHLNEDVKETLEDNENQQEISPTLPTPTPAWISEISQKLQQTYDSNDLTKEHQKLILAHQNHKLRAYVFSSYLQIASNIAIASIIAYVIYLGYQTLKHDVHMKLVSKRNQIISMAQKCAREYIRNDCRIDLRVPMLEELCTKWELCMDKALPFTEYIIDRMERQISPQYEMINSQNEDDPENSFTGFSDNFKELNQFILKHYLTSHPDLYETGANGKTKFIKKDTSLSYFPYIPAVAEIMADVLNAIFETVTVKTTVIIILGSWIIMYLSNFIFGYIRARNYYTSDVNIGNNQQHDQHNKASANLQNENSIDLNHTNQLAL